MRNFKTQELVDKETYDLLGENALKLFNPGLLIDLDRLRDDLDKKIIVNTWYWKQGGYKDRGFRTKKSEVGNLSSQHRIGNAIDFQVEGMDAVDVRTYIMKNKDRYHTINRMEAKVNWVHIDAKPLKIHQERIYLFQP